MPGDPDTILAPLGTQDDPVQVVVDHFVFLMAAVTREVRAAE
jgi:hypothetical protein